MARKTVIVCDVCGAEGTDVLAFKIAITGGDKWGGDICATCQGELRSSFPGVELPPSTPRKDRFGEIVDWDSRDS